MSEIEIKSRRDYIEELGKRLYDYIPNASKDPKDRGAFLLNLYEDVSRFLDEETSSLKKKLDAAESNAKCGWETAKASDKSRTKAEEKFKRQVKLIDIKARVGIYEGMFGEMKAAGASGVSIEKVQGWAHIARKDMLDLEDSFPKKPGG